MQQRAIVVLAAVILGGWAPLRAGETPDSPPLRWTSGFVVPYHIHSAGYSGLSLQRVTAAFDAAFHSWEEPCSTLRFQRVAGRDGDTPVMDGVNVMRFEERGLPAEVDPESTLAFSSHVAAYCTGIVAECDITFNGVNFAWSDARNSRYADIETVALHEIGHLLGLDHTNLRDAVMFPSIQERVRRDLGLDELEAICALYPPNRGQACAHNGDCGGDEICQFGPQSDESTASRCGAPLGPRGFGERCDPEAEVCSTGCASGICLADGTCTVLCGNDRDCPGQASCISQQGPGQEVMSFCVDIPLCEEDVHACPRGQACVFTDHPSEPRLMRMCVDAPGRGALGEACEEHNECAGAVCLGICTHTCDNDADCDGPFDCQGISVPLDGGGSAEGLICQPQTLPCARASDCDAGLSCVFVSDGESVLSVCMENPGGPAGTPCRSYEPCRAGLCLQDGVCSDACTHNRDCPDAMVCGEVEIEGTLLSACVPDDAPAPVRDAGVSRPDATPPASPADAGPEPDGPLGPHPPTEADARPSQPDDDDAAPSTPPADHDTSGRAETRDGGTSNFPFGDPSSDATAPTADRPHVVRRTPGDSGGGCSIGARTSRGPGLLVILGLAIVAIRRRRSLGGRGKSGA